MLKLERTQIFNWEGAIRGMRNPMNSWDKSDSFYTCEHSGFPCQECLDRDFCKRQATYHIGPNDLDLMMRLAKGGPVHAKYRRQIFVSVDITAPLYWWKEFDTYKVGTTANSCSTMHKIHSKAFDRDDFSHDRLDEGGLALLDATIAYLEAERQKFLSDKENRQPWHNMIQMLPSSYNQMRTVTMDYENLYSMYKYRRDHKLKEWHTFCDWIEQLPYSEVITL